MELDCLLGGILGILDHGRGDLPMTAWDRDTLTDKERLEALKAWQDTWKDKGYPYPVPTASFLAGFDAAATRVRAAQAQAWDEGYEQAERDVTQIGPLEKHNLPNPYSDAGDEFQNPEETTRSNGRIKPPSTRVQSTTWDDHPEPT